MVRRSPAWSSADDIAISLRLAAGNLGERPVLVDPEVRGQAEDTLGQDVAHDLGRAALDRVRPGAQEGAARVSRLLPPAAQLALVHLVGVVEHALVPQDVEAEVVAVLVD